MERGMQVLRDRTDAMALRSQEGNVAAYPVSYVITPAREKLHVVLQVRAVDQEVGTHLHFPLALAWLDLAIAHKMARGKAAIRPRPFRRSGAARGIRAPGKATAIFRLPMELSKSPMSATNSASGGAAHALRPANALLADGTGRTSGGLQSGLHVPLSDHQTPACAWRRRPRRPRGGRA